MGAKTRFKDTFYNYVTIMDADEDKLSNLSYINIMNPYNKSYQAKIDASYTVLPITKYTPVTDAIAADASSIKINYNDDATNLTVGNVGAFNPRFFMLSGKTDNVDKLGFTGDVHLFDNKVSGYIVNNYPYDVTDAVVMFYGKMLYIGDIKKGETKNIDSLEIINIPLTNTYIVSGKITGLNDYIKADITDTKYLESLEKSNIIAFYLDYYMSGYTADARVIAFSDESPDNTLIVGDKLDAYGMTMLTSALSVDSKEDNLVYRSVLMKNPTVLSGEYNVSTNSMYGSEPAVLEYSIGNDIDISKLIFEPISDYFLTDYSNEKINYFSGTLALYNYTTGKYDYIKNDKREYDSYELKQYLSPVNTITVRYIYDNSKDTQMDIILPMLDVVGSER